MSEISGRLGSKDKDVRAPADRPEAGPSGARWFRRRSGGHVAVITTRHGSEFRGATVTAHLVASIDPPLLMVSLDQEGQMVEWVNESASFALNLLSWSEQFLADRFSGFAPAAPRRFEGIPFHTEVTGCPVLEKSIAWADCRLDNMITVGDHVQAVGAIVAMGGDDRSEHDPLFYYLNAFRRLTSR